VEILLETEAVRFAQDGGRVAADLAGKAGTRRLTTESVLVAVGRVPNVDNLDLEKAGVQYDKKGVKVDKHLRTTARHIYAAGDIVPPYLFTHVAEYEAVIATTNACIGLPIRKTNYDHVLWATFTEPELAHAGLTEQEARDRYGDSIRVYRWPFKDVDRAKTDVAEFGLSKFVCDKKGRLLGIHILGHAAAELMHEAQLAKTLGIPFSRIAPVIHAYPSYSDAVRQPAKRCYIDSLQNNVFLRFLKKLRRGGGSEK
jgi:pyruvate/2-oxoglutarate dehydrogenase complex dihydrolipoamide dehydrogenase (E3) component